MNLVRSRQGGQRQLGPDQRKTRRVVEGFGNFAMGWTAVVAILLIWQLSSSLGLISKTVVPSVVEIVESLFSLAISNELAIRASETLATWAVGFAIGAVSGTLLGLLIGSSRFAFFSTRLLVDFVRPIPAIAILPLAILLAGTGQEMKTYLIVFGTFFPMLFQAMYGVQDTDPVARDSVRAYGLSPWLRFWKLTLPSASPYLATGLRLSATIGLMVAISVELIVGSHGIGFAINQERYANDPPAMWAWVAVAGLIGLVISMVFRAVEGRILFWHPSQQQGVKK